MTNWKMTRAVKELRSRTYSRAIDRSRRNRPKVTRHGRQHKTR